MRAILLEVAVASLEDALAAQQHGADRLELNSALSLGGLTPSAGLLRAVRSAVSLPMIVMARPRPAGFCYSQAEFETLLADVAFALAEQADGIAFGVLTEAGEIDVPRCAQVMRQIGSREAVFHRAFDVTPEPARALEQLIDLGVRRVLTSGQEPTALQGSLKIAKLVEQARDRIEILPAAGIRPANVVELLTQTGCNQVHASLKGERVDRSTANRPALSFGNGSTEDRYEATDPELVRAMRGALTAYVSR